MLGAPSFRVPSKTPDYTSHEVQRLGNARTLGQQEALSAYMQWPRVDFVSCTRRCHGKSEVVVLVPVHRPPGDFHSVARPERGMVP